MTIRNAAVLIIYIMIGFLCSCEEKTKKVAVFEETPDSQNKGDEVDIAKDDYGSPANEISTVAVPYKDANGVKTIKVTLNGVITVDMIVDTGCSGLSISLAEARYLSERGQLTRDDVIGSATAQIADGSIVNNMMVRLHSINIGDGLSQDNVTAMVSESQTAPLLLGNEVFDRVKGISIDNENKQILFHLN